MGRYDIAALSLTYFARFLTRMENDVRKDIIKHIGMEKSLYNSVGHIVLLMRGCDLDSWCEEMLNEYQFPDELMIYALSQTYNRHTLVMLQNHYWTTLETTEPLSKGELFKACHVHLVYFGNGVFGELKPKPFTSTVPHPITMEKLALALKQVRGKGRPRTKTLDLSVSKPVGMLFVEDNAKGENITVTIGEYTNTHTDTIGSENEINIITDDPVMTSKGGNNDSNMTGHNSQDTSDIVDVHNAKKVNDTPDNATETPETESAGNEASNKQPLIVIPLDFWLVQPQEVSSHVKEKALDNMTGEYIM